MHELSIALSILEVAEEQAERLGATAVFGIHLKLGPLSGVVKESLLSAYGLAREGSRLEKAELLIEETPLLVQCPTCQTSRPVISLQELRCVECGTATADVVSGRELEIVALEIQ